MSTNCMKCGTGTRIAPYGYCEECSKPYLLFDRMKELLGPGSPQAQELTQCMEAIRDAAYDAGFCDALIPYSFMIDGINYVGSMHTPLAKALVDRKKLAGFYRPRI